MEDESWLEYQAGDRPPEGVYACMDCPTNDPYTHMVPEMGAKLPVCPKCDKGHYAKV